MTNALSRTAGRSPWMDDDVAATHDEALKFFRSEALPLREKWENQQHVDREFWLRAGELGFICAGMPTEYGGGGGTFAHDLAIFQAQIRAGESGFGNGVHSGLVAYYIEQYGTEEQKQRWLPPMARGELITAIAMTEPGGGSDLMGLRTTAIREGDYYRLNGSKTFISNGSSADLIVLVVKTDPEAGGQGFSLLCLETAHAEGFAVGRVLNKLGMKAQDTAELFFDDVRVPAENLLGEEGMGFLYALEQLAHERLLIADASTVMMEEALAEATAYAKQREAYGKPLIKLQNTRFELADCATEVVVTRTFLDDCIVKHLRGELDGTTASMAKLWATERQSKVVDRCLQIFGGYGYMMEYPITRLYADSRAQRIYAGTSEVMRELIARSL